MFKYIYELLPKLPKEQHNRLTILQSKLPSFAKRDEDKKILLKWRKNEDENLKGIQMTIGQKWSAVVKAFTIRDLSVE